MTLKKILFPGRSVRECGAVRASARQQSGRQREGVDLTIFAVFCAALLVTLAVCFSAIRVMAQDIPTLSCADAGQLFNTGFNKANGGRLTSGLDANWEVTRPQSPYYESSTPPRNYAYQRANIVVRSHQSSHWHRAAGGNAEWISFNSAGHQGPPTSPKSLSYRDTFFRYQFNLDQSIDPSSLDLKMDFYADDGVYQVWVNSTAQGVRSRSIKSDHTGKDTYYWADSYKSGRGESGHLRSGFRQGRNEIVVQIKSQAEHTGLLAYFSGFGGICKAAISVENQGTFRDANGNGLADAGETIDYNGKVTNTGSLAVTGLRVSNPPVATMAPAQIDSLPIGKSESFTGTYTLTQADIDRGTVGAKTTVAGKDSRGSAISSQTPVNTALPRRAGLEVDKTVSGDGADFYPGASLSYTVKIRNSGNATLSNIKAADKTLDAPLAAPSGFDGSLLPGKDVTLTGRYTPSQAEIDTGSLTNVVTVTATTPAGAGTNGGSKIEGKDDAKATFPADPGIKVEKTGKLNDLNGNGLYDVGETISYKIKVTNTGGVTLRNILPEDTLKRDDGTTQRLALSPSTAQVLAPNTSTEFTASYTVTQRDIDAGGMTNTVTASGTPPGDATPPVSDGDEARVSAPNIKATISVENQGTFIDANSNGLADAGETIDYNVRVTNTGKVGVTGLRVSNPPVAAMAPAQIDSLPIGKSGPFTGTYTLTQADIDRGTVSAEATVTGKDTNGNSVSEKKQINTSLPREAGLEVDKAVSGDGADFYPGASLSYTVTIRNSGNATLSNIKAADKTLDAPLAAPAGFDGSLLPGQNVILTGRYTPSQTEIDTGSLTNVVTVTAATPAGTGSNGGSQITRTDEAKATFPTDAGIKVEKTGELNDLNGNNLYDVGETISYKIKVTNTGRVTLRNILPEDTLKRDDGTTQQLALSPSTAQVLAPNTSAEFTASYTVTQHDIDAGGMANTVTASGTPPGDATPPVSGGDEVRVSAPNSRAAIDGVLQGTFNDVNENGVGEEGETVSFTMDVTNTGTTTLEAVNVAPTLQGLEMTASKTTLAPEETARFTGTYHLIAKDAAEGRLFTEALPAAKNPGGEDVKGVLSRVEITWAKPSTLVVTKTGTFNDVDADGFSSEGDTISYAVTVTNDGGQRIENVKPVDEGVVLPGGQRGSGTLSNFVPATTTLGPGETVTFRADYSLTLSDVEISAGSQTGIVNTATASGSAGKQTAPATPGSATVILPGLAPSGITLIKQAGIRQIHRGDRAPFIISIINNAKSQISEISIEDRLPDGFRYAADTATVDGVQVKPVMNGRTIRIDNITLAAGQTAYVRLSMIALSTLSPGDYENKANIFNQFGRKLAPEAAAKVTVMPDPEFDCADVIGRVFDDRNGDGYFDQGDSGVPGVRVATVTGTLVTTDKHGRFHVACADLPAADIGSNFIMKLDERTLPAGYRLTSENPRVVRLTKGKMTSINFGVAAGHLVDFDLQADAFQPGTTLLKSEWQHGIDQLIAVVSKSQSRLRVTYHTAPSDSLADQRLTAIERALNARWAAVGTPYELDLTTRKQVSQ
ncbi:DUF11 domain-containing protein [Martelella sp. HB161492]|uniref:DUF7507 domain-containing protein n=1 Tax=Martelella sp. HB161492 TaxID=2720726 RepID=UPI00158F9EA7|nr:DUF11 domain-containing protein [Martelella sp. HB161492]